VLPRIALFRCWSRLVGPDRALEAATQALARIPGLRGQYLRRAFLARAIARCHESAAIGFGSVFAKTGAMIDENVYVGPYCYFGLVHLERDVLVAAGVHIPSGGRTHGIDDLDTPIREQPGRPTLIRIGAGSWIGSGAIILADVGRQSVVGAGSVVTRPIPDRVIAAGVPAVVVRRRDAGVADHADPWQPGPTR